MTQSTDIPDAAEFGLFRAAIAKMKDADGKPMWKQQQINDAVGDKVNGRNWGEIREAVLDFLRNVPSAAS